MVADAIREEQTMPERRTSHQLLLRSRSRNRLLGSRSEISRREQSTPRRRIRLYRRRSNPIFSRVSQRSPASSSERAALSARIDALEAFWRDRPSSAVVETPERKDSRRRSRSRNTKAKTRRNKRKCSSHRDRGTRTAEHKEGGSASQASVSPSIPVQASGDLGYPWAQATVSSSRAAKNVYMDQSFDSVNHDSLVAEAEDSRRPSRKRATSAEKQQSSEDSDVPPLMSNKVLRIKSAVADCTTTEKETSIDSTSDCGPKSRCGHFKSSPPRPSCLGQREEPPRARSDSHSPPPRPRQPSVPPPAHLLARPKSSLRPPLAARSLQLSQRPSHPRFEFAVADDNHGCACVVYLYIDAEADIDEVAVDVRNMAPSVLIVCCSDMFVAQQMEAALRREGIDIPAPYWYKPKRRGPEYFQAQFDCVSYDDVIIAGRLPITREVGITDILITPDGGSVLIAEVGYHVSIQGQLTMRLAAFGKSDPHRGSGESWDTVIAALVKRSVRLMAGRFIDAQSLGNACPFQAFLAAARSRMEVKVCAFVISIDFANHTPVYEDDMVKMSASAVCVLGPVGDISMLEYNGSGSLVESDGALSNLNDDSRGWPFIPCVKQKRTQKAFPYTQKVLLYIGSSTSNRSLAGRRRRELTAKARAARRQEKREEKRERQAPASEVPRWWECYN